MEKQKKRGSRIRNVILAAAVLVFAVSAWQLVSIYLEYRQGSDEYDRLADAAEEYLEAAADTGEEAAGQESGGIREPRPWTGFFLSMQAQNPDYVGWIRIGDTQIDYPIVQTEDNDYYLSHTFERTENAAGTLFVDCNITEAMEAKHVIVYGHNMKNGSMFANLKKFRDDGFFDGHRTFQVFTETGFYTYEIFAVYVTEPDSDVYTIGFADEADFMNYIGQAKERSEQKTDVTVSSEDHIITLSTCVNHNQDRLVVQAKRLKS